jgi:hypothetical protein
MDLEALRGLSVLSSMEVDLFRMVMEDESCKKDFYGEVDISVLAQLLVLKACSLQVI